MIMGTTMDTTMAIAMGIPVELATTMITTTGTTTIMIMGTTMIIATGILVESVTTMTTSHMLPGLIHILWRNIIMFPATRMIVSVKIVLLLWSTVISAGRALQSATVRCLMKIWRRESIS
jgi:hypothetical protein